MRGAGRKGSRVIHFIDSLGSGGAQRQLVTLVRALDRADVEPTVAAYHPLYHFRPELDEIEVPVLQLGPGGGRSPLVLARLVSVLRRGRFDLVLLYKLEQGPGSYAIRSKATGFWNDEGYRGSSGGGSFDGRSIGAWLLVDISTGDEEINGIPVHSGLVHFTGKK